METNGVAQRHQFVRAYQSGRWTMTELCDRYQVSRPTGYKWVARWTAEGDDGLAERGRAPQTCPHRTSEAMVDHILAVRRKYGWGAKKLLSVLSSKHPAERWPARSTVNAILEREGLVRKQRRRQDRPHPGAVPLETTAPNQVWPADFKGQFKTGDGVYCYPLTVTDHFSRAVLLCRALPSTKTADARPRLRPYFASWACPTRSARTMAHPLRRSRSTAWRP